MGVPREPAIDKPRINLTWRWIVRHDADCPMNGKSNHDNSVVDLLSDADDGVKRTRKEKGMKHTVEEVGAAEQERRKQRELRFSGGPALTKRDPPKEQKKEVATNIDKEQPRKRDIGDVGPDDEEKRKQRELRFQAGPPMLAKPVGLTKRVPLEEQEKEDDVEDNIAKKRRVERFQGNDQSSA